MSVVVAVTGSIWTRRETAPPSSIATSHGGASSAPVDPSPAASVPSAGAELVDSSPAPVAGDAVVSSPLAEPPSPPTEPTNGAEVLESGSVPPAQATSDSVSTSGQRTGFILGATRRGVQGAIKEL